MAMIKAAKMKNQYLLPSTIQKQSGVVLIVALIFLVALTAVAAALMQNSTIDMKMSGATEQKAVALEEVISAVDEVIFNQVNAQNNRFTRPVTGDNFPITNELLLPDTLTQSIATVDVPNNRFNLDKDCPHMKLASSNGVFSCNLLRIRVVRNYGKNGASNVATVSGIAQQLLK